MTFNEFKKAMELLGGHSTTEMIYQGEYHGRNIKIYRTCVYDNDGETSGLVQYESYVQMLPNDLHKLGNPDSESDIPFEKRLIKRKDFWCVLSRLEGLHQSRTKYMVIGLLPQINEPTPNVEKFLSATKAGINKLVGENDDK